MFHVTRIYVLAIITQLHLINEIEALAPGENDYIVCSTGGYTFGLRLERERDSVFFSRFHGQRDRLYMRIIIQVYIIAR